MSIASYRMATSPSDAQNHNILAWLDRLQASVRTDPGDISAANFASSASASLSGAKKAPNFKSPSFKSTNPNLASHPTFEDSEGEEEGADEGEEDEDEDDADASVLPDASVPLGLIANLSLNSRTRERRGARGGEGATREEDEDDLDDDNVVRNFSFQIHRFRKELMECRAWRMLRTLSRDQRRTWGSARTSSSNIARRRS